MIRDVIACYIAGYKTIEISSHQLTAMQKRDLHTIVNKLIGPEILEETINKVVIHDLLSEEVLPADRALKRMKNVARSMIQDALSSLIKRNKELAMDVIQRDDDVDRLNLLIARQFNDILRSGSIKQEIQSPISAVNYMQAATNLERMADHASKIAEMSSLDDCELPAEMTEELSRLGSIFTTLIDDSISVVLKPDNEKANQLIDKYKPQPQAAFSYDFYDSNIANAQYLYLIARHFPERLSDVGDKLITPLIAAINSDEINTLLSAYTSLALSAYVPADQKSGDTGFSISELVSNQTKTLLAIKETYGKVSVDENATAVQFNNPNKLSYFYQLTQAGFDKTPPAAPLQKGLEIYREYRDLKGNVINTTTLGTEIEVHIQARALDNRYISNTAIVDLLPGGFEVVRDSVKAEYLSYIDIREDRVIFFGGLDDTAKQIVYRIKAINTGTYTAPPIYLESMYDPNVKAYSAAGEMTVTN